MAEIAGIRTSVGDAFAHCGRGDLVAAHGVEQTKCSVGHVTVVTAAAGGIGGVMSVGNESCLHVGVALQARLIGFHPRF